MNFLKIAGIATAVVVFAGLMMNWGDMKRYIKIEQM
jgi:hypothetical protein